MSRAELLDSPPSTLTSVDRASIGQHKEYAHPQTQSPLFSRLPAEIRSLIWTYCVLAHKNLDKPYPTNVLWYRPPDFTHHRVIDTSILQTCRAIYNESRHLPASVNTIVLWLCDTNPSCGAFYDPDEITLVAVDPERSTVHKLKFRSMGIARASRALSLHASRLHVIADQFWLEQWVQRQQEYLPYHISTRHLTITVRRCDWWGWYSDAKLAIDPGVNGWLSVTKMQANWEKMLSGEITPFEDGSWSQMVGKFTSLDSLELELEATTAQESELQAIVKQAQMWRFPIADTSRILIAGKQEPQWSYWRGPKCLNSHSHRLDAEGPELVLVKLVYRACDTA